MSGPRLGAGDRRRIGWAAWAVAAVAGRVAGTDPPALFLTLARHRRLFWGWMHFAATLMPGGRLPRADTELVILRVAHLCGSVYELEHHRRLAGRAGIGPDEVERISRDPATAGWGPRQRALLLAVDELHRTRDLGDDTWERVRALLDDEQCVELCLLVGHYEMLATAITALRIEPDAPRRRSVRGRRESAKVGSRP